MSVDICSDILTETKTALKISNAHITMLYNMVSNLINNT